MDPEKRHRRHRGRARSARYCLSKVKCGFASSRFACVRPCGAFTKARLVEVTVSGSVARRRPLRSSRANSVIRLRPRTGGATSRPGPRTRLPALGPSARQADRAATRQGRLRERSEGPMRMTLASPAHVPRAPLDTEGKALRVEHPLRAEASGVSPKAATALDG